MNKKIGMFALAALVLGAGTSIAIQSFAQTPAPSAAGVQTDQSIDQKDQQGNDRETNDDQDSVDQKDAKGNDLETNDDEKIVGTPSITQAQAQATAKAEYNGAGVLKNTELEMENGTLVYTTEFREAGGNEVDIKINAKDGTVVLVSSDATDIEE